MKDKLCVIPWIHLNVDPDDKVHACCMTTPYDSPVGNLKKQDIKTIWNSSQMRKMRLQFLNNEEPDICQRCFERERASGFSNRIFKTNEFKHLIDGLENITEKDGSTPLNLIYWDFRFSNLCNFKCRSCGPTYSSAWIPDAKKLNFNSVNDIDKVMQVKQIDLLPPKGFIDEHIDKVERIYFAGGEPMMMDEHWYILDKLREIGRTDVNICYNTNFSLVKYKGKNVFDYWKEFDDNKIEVWPSIDEIGERAELIRSGTNWKKIHQNFKDLAKLKKEKNIVVRPSITVGAMNVFRIPTIVEYFRSHGLNEFSINMINYPHFYSVCILPNEIKQRAKEDIMSYCVKNKINPNIFKELFSDLDKPQNLESAKMFIRHNFKLDEIRNENIYNVIPELECIKECFIV